jgi:RNA polymerase sigma factor for flagellar operon FliA
LPEVHRLAETLARVWHVRTPEGIEDCRQTAAQALLESYPGFDDTRGIPLRVYAWKRVFHAVRALLAREAPMRRGGLEAALDEAETLHDPGDPFAAADDADALAELKGHSRSITFVRFMGDYRERAQAHPEEALDRAHAFEALKLAFGGLEELEARLLELRYWSDLSWSKVAAALGIHEKYAQRLDEQLRARLKRDLRSRGVHEAP